jgi:DNA-binding response OmpR family regulator
MLEDADFAKSLKLVITDHLMPGMNGPQFVTELRRRFPRLPILVLSGLPDGETEYNGMNVTYRVKPIAPEQLIQFARSFCRDRLGRTA